VSSVDRVPVVELGQRAGRLAHQGRLAEAERLERQLAHQRIKERLIVLDVKLARLLRELLR
jgi:hypothetical protein